MNNWLYILWDIIGFALMITVFFVPSSPVLWVAGLVCFIKADTMRIMNEVSK